MAWISFPNLLLTFFIKESRFTPVWAIAKLVHLDITTIKKIKPSCARVKIQVDLMSKLPKSIKMKIENKDIGDIHIERVKIHHDVLTKYYKECKLQGHNKDECIMLHP